MKRMFYILAAIMGVVMALLAAPSQIASGVEDWRIILQSESFEDAVEELNK